MTRLFPLLCCLALATTPAQATSQDAAALDGARSAFLGFLQGLLPVFKNSASSAFSVKSCTTWNSQEAVPFLLMGRPLERDLRFKEQCDIEGHLTAVLGTPFDVDLKLRHLADFGRVTMKMKITLTPNLGQGRVEIQVDCLSATLYGKGNSTLTFSGDYRLNYLIGNNTIDNTAGGHVIVHAMNGKSVELSEPIVVK